MIYSICNIDFIKNILKIFEPQILDILRTLSLGSKVLVLIKKKSVFQPGHVLNNVLKCSMYLKNAIIMTKCNIFSEIKDRKSQNFEEQKKRIQVGTYKQN